MHTRNRIVALQPFQQPRDRRFKSLSQHFERRQADVLLAALHVRDIATVDSQPLSHLDLSPASFPTKRLEPPPEPDRDVLASAGHSSSVRCSLTPTNRPKPSRREVVQLLTTILARHKFGFPAMALFACATLLSCGRRDSNAMSPEFRKEGTAAWLAIGNVRDADWGRYSDDDFGPLNNTAWAALRRAGLYRKTTADDNAYLLLDAVLENAHKHHDLFMRVNSASFDADYYSLVGEYEEQCFEESLEYFDAKREILRGGKPIPVGKCLKRLLASESPVPKPEPRGGQ